MDLSMLIANSSRELLAAVDGTSLSLAPDPNATDCDVKPRGRAARVHQYEDWARAFTQTWK